jgi:type IV secretion system protein VirB10
MFYLLEHLELRRRYQMTRCCVLCFVLLTGMVPGLKALAPGAAGAEASQTASTPAANDGLKTYTVPAGTKLLLSLKHEISTRVARPGDQVYLMSDFPVVEDGAVVIPAGMYVKGTIDSVQRPGKVKGRAQLQMHLTAMIFPNGVEIAIPGSLDNVPGSTGAKVKNSEGTVEQAGTKGRDAQRVAENTGEGAAVGGLVGMGTGSMGKGIGIGAGAGAAVGVLTTLFTRGNDIVFPQGTTLEMVLSRPLVVQQEQLAGMPAYTGIATSAPVGAGSQQSPAATPKPNH